jgi:hypothetical protein
MQNPVNFDTLTFEVPTISSSGLRLMLCSANDGFKLRYFRDTLLISQELTSWPPGERTAEDYHKRFRSLISLTALVSRINHDDGQSAIFKGSQQNTSFDERKLPARDLVLNATAAILVRDFEVVATVYHDPGIDTVSKTNRPPTYEVFAMQNAPSLAEDDSYFPPLPFDGTEFMAGISAVTNPREIL